MNKKFILAIPITLVFISIITLFSSLSKSNVKNNNPNVKKSTSNICHEIGSQYYKQTKKYVSYSTIEDCLNSGGRLPR